MSFSVNMSLTLERFLDINFVDVAIVCDCNEIARVRSERYTGLNYFNIVVLHIHQTWNRSCTSVGLAERSGPVRPGEGLGDASRTDQTFWEISRNNFWK